MKPEEEVLIEGCSKQSVLAMTGQKRWRRRTSWDVVSETQRARRVFLGGALEEASALKCTCPVYDFVIHVWFFIVDQD